MIKLLSVYRKILSADVLTNQIKVSCKFHLSSRFPSKRIDSLQKTKRTFRAFEEKEKKKLNPFAISLLIIPVTSFCLGCWQIYRKKWKEDLIADMRYRVRQEPVPLPEDFDELNYMEYYPVQVKGKFLHDREIYIGPRSLIIEEGKGNVSHGLGSSSRTGYLVVTPFVLSDNGKTILVNRGWISLDQFKDGSYDRIQGINEIELTGIVRLTEKIPQYGKTNSHERCKFAYRDLQNMAKVADTEPVFLDANASSTVPGGPIAGQTRISLRNEHLSYIITWFGLSLASSGLWYLKYMKNL